MRGDVLNVSYTWERVARGVRDGGGVANGTVVQPTGIGGGVAPMVTVSAAVGVRAVGVGAVVLGCWGCAWF